MSEQMPFTSDRGSNKTVVRFFVECWQGGLRLSPNCPLHRNCAPWSNASRTGTARGARPVYTCNFCCDFSNLGAIFVFWCMWTSIDEYECSEYMYPYLNIHNSSTHSHLSEEEIAAKIAANIASVNGPVYTAFKTRLQLAIFAAISSAIFFWWMWTIECAEYTGCPKKNENYWNHQ